MKLNFIPCIIAVAICALIVFGMYTWCRMEEMHLLVTIVSGIGLLLTFGTLFAVSFPSSRTSINIKVTSGVFAGIILITNIVFCCISSFSQPLYIILNGFLLLSWILSVYGIARANKEV